MINKEPQSEDYSDSLYRILCLDGGGSKGFYTLGVLKEIESLLRSPLHERFDLVFGTSTGAIIASLISLGYKVDDIHDIYKSHVPTIMKKKSPRAKTEALAYLVSEVYGDKTFGQVKTGIGVVATKWNIEKPMIFKSDVKQAHGRKETFTPGFGVSIADAVQASCSAYPFFEQKVVTTNSGDIITLIDGGYCANNPTLYAIADAVAGLKKKRSDIRVVSIGVGSYPEPKPKSMKIWFAKKYLKSVQLLEKTLEINTASMEQLRTILFPDIKSIRISDTFQKKEMATDLMEHDLSKLNLLYQLGRESFGKHETDLRLCLIQSDEQ